MTQRLTLRDNGYALARDLKPNLIALDLLRALGRQTRKHPDNQLRKLATSIESFGFVLPVVIDECNRVIAGWGLVLAAKRLGLTEIPAVTICGLGEAELRSLRLALNRLGENSGWDREALALEFSDIFDISRDFDLKITGFEMGEIDVLIGGIGTAEEDDLPIVDLKTPPITRPGECWVLGAHRVLCADALAEDTYIRLLAEERALFGGQVRVGGRV